MYMLTLLCSFINHCVNMICMINYLLDNSNELQHNGAGVNQQLPGHACVCIMLPIFFYYDNLKGIVPNPCMYSRNPIYPRVYQNTPQLHNEVW